MGPLRQHIEYEAAAEHTVIVSTRLVPSSDFYDDVTPGAVRQLQDAADAILGDDDLELVDGYDDRR